MIRTFHFALGLVIIVVQIYVLSNLTTLLPLFGPHPDVPTAGREGAGEAIFELLPFISAGLFIFADTLTDRLSPRSQFTGEPLIGNGLWYLLGYGTLLVSIALYALLASA